jgi:hypothetical protein
LVVVKLVIHTVMRSAQGVVAEVGELRHPPELQAASEADGVVLKVRHSLKPLEYVEAVKLIRPAVEVVAE